AQSSLVFLSALAAVLTPVALGGVDRIGAYREVEALLASDPSAASKVFARLRASRTKPATLNKSPCQYSPVWRFIFEHHSTPGGDAPSATNIRSFSSYCSIVPVRM